MVKIVLPRSENVEGLREIAKKLATCERIDLNEFGSEDQNQADRSSRQSKDERVPVRTSPVVWTHGRTDLRVNAAASTVLTPTHADSSAAKSLELLRLALVYDMDACRWPTGVTRHALGQLDQLAKRPDVSLRVVSGRILEPDGLAYWEHLGEVSRRELPISMKTALRFWRISDWPPVEWWTGSVDWVYCPAEYALPTREARLAVTSHDVLQEVLYGGARRLARLGMNLAKADVIFSVSQYNTARLLEHFPACAGRIEWVPNAADDLYFEPAAPHECAAVRADFSLPDAMPYMISVANFQARKNLPRLVRAAARLREVVNGELALVLLGEGSEEEKQPVRQAIAELGPRAVVRMPGYRQGRALRAAYAEAVAMVFPSLCESFGIPVVEAMAQGLPVVLANSTALPEIGGSAGWYFDPKQEEQMSDALRQMLDRGEERARKIELGRQNARLYRWERSCDLMLGHLRRRS